MPDQPAKPAKLYIRVSVGVSDKEYGAEIMYSTTRYIIDRDHPLIPASDAEADTRRMMRSAFQTIAVERAYAEAIGKFPDVDPPAVTGTTIQDMLSESPEMPGPGYDEQTKKIDAS